MPRIPKPQSLTHDGVDILNAIRNSASATYKDRVPIATQDNIKEIGDAIMNYQPNQNEFLNALVNRIARVIITSKSYQNPLRRFKKGILEYGETIEEIFVNIAKAHPFDPILAEKTVFKREIPDVSAVFHRLNYKNFYKVTISNDQLRQAFLSAEGISDLIAKIVDSLYAGSEFDEFLIMKQLIVDAAKAGKMYPITVPAPTAANAKEIVTIIKGVSNQLEFMSSTYNAMGVLNYTKKPNQILIVDARFDAVMDVEVLASAFNMDKAEFMGQRVLIDNFAELTGAVAALVDEAWFMVYDNYITFTENYNGEGLYWNYFYHLWKTFSTSPFSNAILFTTETQSVTSVTVTPATATVPIGGVQQFNAVVVGSQSVPQGVTWEVTGANPVKSMIDWTGKLMVMPDETNTTLTVTATSVYDNTKKATATVSVTGQKTPIETLDIVPQNPTVKKGDSQQFSANVTVSGATSTTVTWTIEGATDSTISDNGLLTVGTNETATSIIVNASLADGEIKAATTAVIVEANA